VKAEAAGCSKYQPTWRYIQEGGNLEITDYVELILYEILE
jgi:hypothetical protein